MDIIRKAARLFKDDVVGVLTISFLWCSILFITIMLGRTVGYGYGIGFYIFLMIPATISLRFVYYTYSMGKPIAYGSFKIGFVTIISSIKLYFRMIKEALVVAVIIIFVGLFGMGFVINRFFPEAASTIADMYKAKELLTFAKLFNIVPWSKWALLGIGAVSAITYYLIKMQYNFLPYIAFQSPIDARSAKDMGSMMARRKYARYILLNASALLFIVPVLFGSHFLYEYLTVNKVLHSLASYCAAAAAACLAFVPILAFYGLLNVVYYNRSSIPFQSQINHALDKLLNELKNLEENDFKDSNKDKKE